MTSILNYTLLACLLVFLAGGLRYFAQWQGQDWDKME